LLADIALDDGMIDNATLAELNYVVRIIICALICVFVGKKIVFQVDIAKDCLRETTSTKQFALFSTSLKEYNDKV
jgi:hypothetical protein